MPSRGLVFVVVGLIGAATTEAADQLGSNRDIRPILSDNCFGCQGPDDRDRKAGLRLDTPPQAVDSGLPPIVLGKPEASELNARILADDADVIMPPPESHKTLSVEQKATLRRWIAEGAAYEPHWA